MRIAMIAVLLFAVLGGYVASGSVPAKSESGLMCTLTGKRIDACCCQMKDGALYCPLAKQKIDHCCYKMVD